VKIRRTLRFPTSTSPFGFRTFSGSEAATATTLSKNLLELIGLSFESGSKASRFNSTTKKEARDLAEALQRAFVVYISSLHAS